MNNYFLFNVSVTTGASVVVWLLCKSLKDLWLAIRCGLFVALFAYPWDYFAIAQGAWTYSNPGPRLYGVPLNDLWFIFSCTLLTSAVLEARVFSCRVHDPAGKSPGTNKLPSFQPSIPPGRMEPATERSAGRLSNGLVQRANVQSRSGRRTQAVEQTL